METIATGLRELSVDNEELPLSVHTVVSNDDLLIEILLRLPVVSLVLFKSVSKRWLSLIKDDAFIKRRSRIPKIDPPSGVFVHLRFNKYGFVSFDIRIPSRDKNIFNTVPCSSTTILQSCNGLFLCSVNDEKFCVYNPTLNLFKMLPEPLYYELKHNFTRMDFDPTKSPHYKVMHATFTGYLFRIQTYSSETGIWSIVCSCSEPCRELWSGKELWSGIYWNDAIHWITSDCLHYKLEYVDKTVILTKIQLPAAMVNNVYLRNVDSCCKMFESRGCLLLIGKDKTHSNQMNVYEMRNGHSEWSIKYYVNDSRITLGDVKCIALGEREEDSFMVIKLDAKVVLYKFVLKTFCELPELESMLSKRRDYSSTGSFLFTASFASV